VFTVSLNSLGVLQVVIMLVIDKENDRVLLSRQSRFVPRMWSCLAGFIEVQITSPLILFTQIHLSWFMCFLNWFWVE
jgi:uncharacterized membrane protein AbrB (regulator of aidB expression)